MWTQGLLAKELYTQNCRASHRSPTDLPQCLVLDGRHAFFAGRAFVLYICFCLIYLSALFMAAIKDLEKALSATAVSRQGRIYRKTLYGDFCRYES